MPSTARLNTLQRTVLSPRQRPMQKAEVILTQLPDEMRDGWATKLARYLLADEDLDIVSRAIEALNAETFPTAPLDTRKPSGVAVLSRTSLGLQRVIRICIAFREAPASEALKLCSRRFYSILAEAWETVIRWMRLLVTYRSLNSDSTRLVYSYAHLLSIILDEVESDACREDILCRPETVDFIFFLLTQVDPETGRYCLIHVHTDRDPCTIIELTQMCLGTTHLGAVLASRFWSYRKAKRDAIVESLLSRAENLASLESITVGNTQNLIFLILIVGRFSLDLEQRFSRQHQNAFFRLSSALCALSERAHREGSTDGELWPRVANCIGILMRSAATPIGKGSVLQLVQGGILRCVALCSRKITTTSCRDILLSLVPYLYPYKVVQAAFSHQEVEYWLKALPQDTPLSIYKEERSYSNMQQPEGMTSTDAIQSSIARRPAKRKTGPNSTPGRSKFMRSWPSLHRRADTLCILEKVANSACPSPADLSKVERTVDYYDKPGPSNSNPPLLRFKPTSAVLMLDYHVSRPDKALVHRQMPLESYFSPHVWGRQHMAPALPRYQRFIDEMEENQDTTILVAGRFRINEMRALIALALMRYSADAEEGQKYTVAWSTFWTGQLSLSGGG
ncbi:hypothetical protein NMY22_g657 [Coprinellus aureogranulatus]|nr:hypothetical protein NMY22_g657 [Coprinellus aureogranulatus]